MRIDAISVGENPPHEINVIVEVPVGGEPIKYELDKASGTLFVDRFLYTPMRYPGNYGFVPHTLSDDGDPIDVLVCNTRAIVPGAVASAETVQEEEAETVEAEPVSEVAQAEPVVNAEPAAAAAVVAVPAAAATSGSEKSGAVTYGNENIAFFLIDQGDKLSAYVVRSSNENYAQGEMIGTFEKSSLPNVYRVEWKDMDKDIEQTTGYFDEDGNLKIDVKRDGKVEVLTFVKE